MAERTIYLIRHGQLDMKAFARDQFAAGLTAKGRQQARCTARRLRSLTVTAIHSSTIGRAKQTADILAKEFPGVSVRPTQLLWELPNLGPAADPVWRKHFEEKKKRGERAYRRFVRPARHAGEVTILVTHGNLIRYFVCRVLGIPPESWTALGTSHCGVTQLTVSDSGPRVVCYNDTGHLRPRPVR